MPRPGAWSKTPTSSRARARSDSTSACRVRATSASWTASSSTARSSTTAAPARSSSRPSPSSPSSASPRRTSSPTSSRRRRSRARSRSRRRRSARRCAASGSTRTASRSSRSPPGVTWVDDSKATNPHAAASSLAAYPGAVWIVGGLLKGVDIADLVAGRGAGAKAAIVIGVDRDPVLAAFERHAPGVPVFAVDAA